jgi:hypothetical protein
VPLVIKYEREEVIQAIEEATAGQSNRRSVKEWGCDCGCGNALFLRRTDAGMALSTTMWPVDMRLRVSFLESEHEVDRWLIRMGSTLLTSTEEGRERYASLRTWAWSVWYDN